MGIADELDPIERELLATPYGEFRRDQRIDAENSCEAAEVLCWVIGLLDRPEKWELADHNAIVSRTLSILRPEARAIIRAAALRPVDELVAYCKKIAAIRSALHQLRVDDPAKMIVRKVFYQRLAEVGLSASEHDLEQARLVVAVMSPDDRRLAPRLAFKREHAMMWLFDSRPTWFSASAS